MLQRYRKQDLRKELIDSIFIVRNIRRSREYINNQMQSMPCGQDDSYINNIERHFDRYEALSNAWRLLNGNARPLVEALEYANDRDWSQHEEIQV